jgi:hypothetical protein
VVNINIDLFRFVFKQVNTVTSVCCRNIKYAVTVNGLTCLLFNENEKIN